MKSRLLLLALFISINCFSQFSKTHYIPPLSNTDAYETLGQFMYISTPSLTDINYRIIALGGTITTGTVRRDNPQTVDIGTGSDTQLLANGNKVSRVLNNKGYIVEADDLIYVTVRLTAASNNHAGGLVSKGLAALGTQFRIGAMINTGVVTDSRHYTFASILATENNTVISFSDIKPGVILNNNVAAGNTPSSVTLNAGQSYIISAEGPHLENSDGLIGALISSTKPVAVNCGSYGGSNGTISNNSDIGFDQIVSAERTGTEYIFIRGDGEDIIERPTIVAHENNTEVFLNGNATPFTILNAGEYVALNGSQFSVLNNLYVRTSKKVFAYQGIGGSTQANQNMHFLPPLSCETPKAINNIPFINSVGANPSFTGTVCLVTETGASLDFIINGTNHTLTNLPPGVVVNGPSNVTGNPLYQTYMINGLTGNVSVFSSKSVYLSYYGSSGAATYGGFYSGFTFKPEISFNKLSVTSSNCIPNVKLAINSITSFDTFEWFFNGVLIPGAISNEYTPTQPGFYKVRASISGCGSPIESDEIPVSSCPTDLDGDLANDNIDIDNDNNGIVNCVESYGNQDINIVNPSIGIVSVGTYNNTFSGLVTNSLPTAPNPFTGSANGSFVTEIPAGKGYYVSYSQTYSQPINITLEYPLNANATDLINANAEYIVNADINKTVTVLNPTNQLLIDTNYDGIYESGVTEFSSFEIRFRLNGSVPLVAGTGTFKFQSYQTSTFKVTHKNLLDSAGNKSTFKLTATCVPNDTDGDSIQDQMDPDNDNDGILDITEAQGNSPLTLSNFDTNSNGLDNAFEPGLTPVDTDLDLIPDYLDLDSDNDGILDSVEGIVDTDNDGIKNYRELDSDNDLCNDVIEAGFSDGNNDGILGALTPPTVNQNGMVTSGVGYTAPNPNYVNSAPIEITQQPQTNPACELQTATITVADNGGNTYQWQLSTDNGTTWNNLANNAIYSNVTTNTLSVNNITVAMSAYKYRVRLDKTGNSCGLLSDEISLSILSLPVVTSPITIVECDKDTTLDGITTINLTLNNSQISIDAATQTFTYYPTQADAQNENIATQITNPTAYVNTTSPGAFTVWTTVKNPNGCFSVAQINVQVVATQIPSSYTHPPFNVCDDNIPSSPDTDGITTFDVSSVTTDLLTNILPAGTYSIKYYRNQADHDSQINEITDPSNFRNDIPNSQVIWVRVNSSVSNDCIGYAKINLVVNPLPSIDLTDQEYICSDNPLWNKTLTAGINDGSSTANYTYRWFKDTDEIIGQTGPTYQVNKEGTYTVEVKTSFNCPRTRTITVKKSNSAVFLETTVIDLQEENTVTINVTGDGNYVYSLDNELGPYQESNTFYNVSPDIHTVYVKDLYGCPTSEKTVNVVGAPKFFTPNGDGYHDHWNIVGLSKTFNARAKIYIYNRFGKLLKQISATDQGWNGTFNGVPQPADDYWYTLELENGRTAKGHFALKR